MKLKNEQQFMILAIMFFVIAAALSVTVWKDVSLAAKIGFFAFGFGSGVTAGGWLALRRSSK